MKISTAFLLTTVVIGAVATMGTRAHSQSMQMPCTDRQKFETHLKNKYKEIVAGIGVGTKGKYMYEIFVSPSGSWTFMRTDTKGTSCFLLTGQDWNMAKPKKDSGI